MARSIGVIAVILALAFWPAAAGAQSDDDCFDCHDDQSLTKNEAGRVVSLFVDRDHYESSIHGQQDIACADCHDAIDDLPHAVELDEVDCAVCHDDVADQYLMSLHGELADEGAPFAPHCWDCHGAHGITPPEDPLSAVNRFNIPFMCGRCHKEGTKVTEMYAIPQDSILTHYSLSIHGEGVYRRGLIISAVCTDCHTAHMVLPHTDPRSTIHRDNIAAECQKCHGRIEQVHKKVIEGVLWEHEPHKVPACIECHEPHKVRRVFYAEGMSNRECLECHGAHDIDAAADSTAISLYVDADEFFDSGHQSVSCIQCHTGATPSHTRPCDTVTPRVNCAICHAEVVLTYQTSRHGVLAERGDAGAPDCNDCHSTHNVRLKRDIDSPTHVRNVPDLCGRCHDEGGVADLRSEHDGPSMVENYKQSTHGRALSASGLVVSATCTDCHTAHGVLPPDDVNSTISPAQISNTCARCHEGIFEEFQHSIHFTGEPKDGHALPLCNDCHSSHEIARTDASGFMLHIVGTCGRCHERDTEAYFQTYHGKVFHLGYTETAKCQDCHGAHNILPPTDVNSTLSRDNVVATCAQCHKQAHRQFAGYLTHATHHDRDKYPFIYWTWLFMTSLLVGTFVFFGIHTLLWLPRSFQAMRHARDLREKPAAKQFLRFPRLYRQLHILVIISFLGLAVTGMTLKFSYLPWAQWIARVLGGFQSAGTIHRICALITFYYFGRHVLDLFHRRRASGKSWREFITGPDGMMFNKHDLHELAANFKWFIGMGPRPDYGRWTYWEKFDYFAVFWGVGMIGISGLMLWFPVFFTRFLPGWFINVASIIHSDEALLATGFIFTVHFFNTHFRPDRFPMDPVIFTGRLTVEELKADRPREYEELVAAGELEDNLVEPMNPTMVKALRIFGFTALAIGLSLILLIIGAELFGYR